MSKSTPKKLHPVVANMASAETRDPNRKLTDDGHPETLATADTDVEMTDAQDANNAEATDR